MLLVQGMEYVLLNQYETTYIHDSFVRKTEAKRSEKTIAEKIATICDEYDFYYMISLELNEDLTDLKKAIKGRTRPMDIYDHVFVTVERNINSVV
ncbi:hypothetical protein [Bacillus cereus]|uniref:hypothetical protein n=1 Tax=Bacillus cereus TaxID=1396 RepID=UPI0020D27955|nr:hypothetical protein [Bacillus cereus]